MDEIVMYGADWCGDCRRAKAYLDERGVPYRYVDVAADPSMMDVVSRYNGGATNIPVIVFPDGSHLTEPSNDTLATKLA